MQSSLKAIMARKMMEMRWQLSLTVLAQPALTEEAVKSKNTMIDQLMSLLSDDEREEVPMDDDDTLALLRMAGRVPIRTVKVNASS